MAEADALYVQIIDLGLRSDATAEKIEATARELRDDGKLDIARALVACALQGTAFMPHLKMRLRTFSDAELSDD